MHYELAKDLVILTGNAYLEQLDSNIGDKITYLVKEQKMQAFQRERQTRDHRSGSVAAAGQRQGQAPAQKKSN
jgi:lipopolysaccharide export system protein LptA